MDTCKSGHGLEPYKRLFKDHYLCSEDETDLESPDSPRRQLPLPWRSAGAKTLMEHIDEKMWEKINQAHPKQAGRKPAKRSPPKAMHQGTSVNPVNHDEGGPGDQGSGTEAMDEDQGQAIISIPHGLAKDCYDESYLASAKLKLSDVEAKEEYWLEGLQSILDN